MDTQLEHAVEIAASPHSSTDLKQQAITFIQSVRDSDDGWQACLSLFVRTPRASETTRHVSLDILRDAVDRGSQVEGNESIQYIKQILQEYVTITYGPGPSAPDSPFTQNKLSQVLTVIFVTTYTTTWPTFFDDLMALGRTDPNGLWDNYPGVEFFIRVSASVHDEIADTLIPRTPQEGQRNIRIKDAIRARDVAKLVTAWQEILEQWKRRSPQLAEMALRVIGRWVSWIDISLVVNETMMRQLYEFMDSTGFVRSAALHALTEVVAKKMKAPDKLELINFLNVGQTVERILQSSALQNQDSLEYDTDLAEGAAKLMNTAALDVVLIMNKDSNDDATRQRADSMLQIFLPLVLRFLSDQYDEVTQAVFPVLTELLSLFRREKKINGGLSQAHASMLPLILNGIVMKMKYDSEATWGDEDEQTDEAEFEYLRKQLKTMQDTVSQVDEALVRSYIVQLVVGMFDRIQPEGGSGSVDWRELDLALYELYNFQEIVARYGGLSSKGKPVGAAAENATEMLGKMMSCAVANYPHPAIKLQSMEIFTRYCPFFEAHTSFIRQALESFVKCIHDEHVRVRVRSWYLFHRFVKSLRPHMGEVAETILGAMSDLLAVEAELAESNDDEMSSGGTKSEDATFDAQLYLFETVGSLCSSPSIPAEKQAILLKSVFTPLFSDIEKHLGPGEGGDARAVLQIHHDIVALERVARGLSDPSSSARSELGQLVLEDFLQTTEAVLVALERLNRHSMIRDASRSALSRLIGVLGQKILPYIPRWISGLMVKASTRTEIASFLKIIEQILHEFRNAVYDMLDELLSPLLQQLFRSLSESTAGTDDELEQAELRRGFLTFILAIINNDLGQALVSDKNQTQFQTTLEAIEHYARTNTDPATQKIAFNVLTKLSYVFGPPVGVNLAKAAVITGANAPQEQTLPGFESLMTDRFALLCWEVPYSKQVSTKDAQGKAVLGEIAFLQKMLYLELGDVYLRSLRESIFPRMGVTQGVDQFCDALQSVDGKDFKVFFTRFIQETFL